MNITHLADAVSLLTGRKADSGKQETLINEAVLLIEEASKLDGLDPTTLITLISYVAGKCGGNEQTRARVVSCLVPRTRVPYLAVLKALGCMGTLEPFLQQLLFKWMVDVYYLIDSHAPVHAVYNAVFLYIHDEHLRPVVCQFLCYLTRKSDVTKHRAHKLLQLHQQLLDAGGTDGALLELLSTYKLYCPHLITIPVPAGCKILCSQHFNALLMEKILHAQTTEAAESTLEQQACQYEDTAPPATKCPRMMVDTTEVACVHPAAEHVGGHVGSVVPTAQPTSFEELCANVDRVVALSTRVGLVLKSDVLKYILSIDVDPTAAVHLLQWLQLSLGYEVSRYNPGEPCYQLEHLLTCLVELGEFLCEPIPIVEGFLEAFLKLWDGKTHQKAVLGLLPFLPLKRFEDLYSTVLTPIEQLYRKEGIEFKYDCLMSLIELLRKMVTLEWNRRKRLHGDGDHRVSSVFSEYYTEDTTGAQIDAAESIKRLASYSGRLAVLGLQDNNECSLLQHAALSLCELVCGLREEYNIPVVILPPVPLVYGSLLSGSVVPLSRICACLTQYKEVLSKLPQSERDHKLTVTFNSIVLDFCDALWRNLAFVNSQRPYPTLLFTLPREVLHSCGLVNTHEKLSITHHPALLGVVKQFFQTLEKCPPHPHPAMIFTQANLRKAYLQYLLSHQLASLVRFIRAFVLTKLNEST
eukprot:Em0021g664a